MVLTDREHAQRHAKEETPARGAPDHATSMPSSAHDQSDPKRLDRDRRRLEQARASLERLHVEMRHDLQESEHRYACATVRIRPLLRDAERRDREYLNARHRIRLLLNDAVRRDREFASVRRQVRLLLDAERRDRDYAGVRAQLRALRHLSAGLAAGFLAITASRRWRLGDALLSLPNRVLGRRPATVADNARALATTLALGQVPRPADSPDHDKVDHVDH